MRPIHIHPPTLPTTQPTTQPLLQGKLHPHERVLPHPGPLTQHEKLVKNAQKLVSQTFFGNLLKQMHNSPFKSKIFSGGRGGDAFGSLLDQHLADRMASGAGGGLVDSMVDRWEHPRVPGLPGNPPAPTAQQRAAQQRAEQAALKRNAYRQAPAPQWSKYVPANLRA